MTAKEMFEKLGYEQYQNKNDKEIAKTWGQQMIIRYRDRNGFEIIFDFWDHDFCKFGTMGNLRLHSGISMNELQAINKQCEELGWNNANIADKEKMV